LDTSSPPCCSKPVELKSLACTVNPQQAKNTRLGHALLPAPSSQFLASARCLEHRGPVQRRLGGLILYWPGWAQ
jgi:hypothetical protein